MTVNVHDLVELGLLSLILNLLVSGFTQQVNKRRILNILWIVTAFNQQPHPPEPQEPELHPPPAPGRGVTELTENPERGPAST
ncbi:MAG: hypothetical protein ACI8ZB_001379 [Desulforhopalus sp.]|jgi:hypothetical protein